MADSTARLALDAGREATLVRLHALTTEFEEIVTASAGANGDDEHDPEGPTVAFERAQLAALIVEAEGQLAELDRARSRLEAGTYGECERCGGRIAEERLMARPGVRVCVACAVSAPTS